MIECHICKEQFKNNLGGQLTNHLIRTHSLSFKDWIVANYFNGIVPRCLCGMCNEEPEFYRKKFLKYALGHSSFKWRNERHVELYGYPKCKTCGKEVGFKREHPLKYCSFSCQGKGVGYKSSKKHSEKSRLNWLNFKFRNKAINAIKKTINTPEERARRSEQQKKLMANQEHLDKLMATGGMRGRLSKLHLKIREQLNLKEKGFKSEQIVGYYCVDELNENTKTIIEINGNYIHANPVIYKSDNIIRIPGESYIAQEKWDRDKRKIDYLKNKGYQVFVIWESDNLEQWKEIIQKL